MNLICSITCTITCCLFPFELHASYSHVLLISTCKSMYCHVMLTKRYVITPITSCICTLHAKLHDLLHAISIHCMHITCTLHTTSLNHMLLESIACSITYCFHPFHGSLHTPVHVMKQSEEMVCAQARARTYSNHGPICAMGAWVWTALLAT
jgi:hypothetical protein